MQGLDTFCVFEKDIKMHFHINCTDVCLLQNIKSALKVNFSKLHLKTFWRFNDVIVSWERSFSLWESITIYVILH